MIALVRLVKVTRRVKSGSHQERVPACVVSMDIIIVT